MKVYIAGPMSGKPEFNFPAFRRAAQRLRDAGYEVISPVELDEADGIDVNEIGADDVAPGSWEWVRCLVRDLELVVKEVDAVVVLPGHTKSRGAYMETSIAAACGKPVIRLNDALLVRVRAA